MSRWADRLAGFLVGYVPWTNVYGLGRSLMALSAALTLALNPTGYLFRPSALVVDFPPHSAGVGEWGLYCIGGDGGAAFKKWVAVGLLGLVASGWRPRFTGVLHWWLVFSYQTASFSVEGGDHVSLVMTMLLVPVTLLDPRRSHWDPPPATPPGGWALHGRLVAWLAFAAIRAQMVVVYLHSAVGKSATEAWRDGTAVYYWFSNPVFGAPGWLRPLTDLLTAWPLTLALLTWSPLFLEILLAMAVFMGPRGRRFWLWAGIAMHAGFACVFGLWSFSVIMFGALVLYLCDPCEPLRWPRRGGHSPADSDSSSNNLSE